MKIFSTIKTGLLRKHKVIKSCTYVPLPHTERKYYSIPSSQKPQTRGKMKILTKEYFHES